MELPRILKPVFAVTTLVLVLGLLVGFIHTTPVLAVTQKATATPSPKSTAVPTPTPVATASAAPAAPTAPVAALAAPSNPLPALQAQYATQLDIYRTDERNFGIAKDQYTQLQTLTALEDAVRATQKVLLSRDDVLLTYLSMLQYTFSQTTGIQIGLKNTLNQKLSALTAAVAANKNLAAHANSRAQVAQVVADFTKLSGNVQQVSAQVLMVMSYGKIQALFDKTSSIRDEMKSAILQQETDALQLSIKQRAFDQIDQTVQSVGGQLQNVLQALNAAATDSSQYFQSTNTAEQLNQAYAGISRTLSYLKEVVQPSAP